jgi:2-polyprenyl-3-methyl-5-hydroxy-6-metoxy-1,4-benzoquinol methylase
MFEDLENINARPEPFEFYTAEELWTDEYTSEQMLKYHLNEDVDVSSRNAKFIDRSVDWIVNRLKVRDKTKIADFGCGPGLYTTKLAKRGAGVTGIDFSIKSIQFARETAVRESVSINYVNKNYLEFETDEQFDLIFMIMCDFCALSPVQRKLMLNKFHKFLKPGGAVLLDVYSLNSFSEREETATYEINLLDGFWSKNKYYGFLNTFVYKEEKVVLDKYTIFESSRTRTIYNWLQYFSPESLESELLDSGFRIENLYSDVAGSPFDPETNEFAIIARLE